MYFCIQRMSDCLYHSHRNGNNNQTLLTLYFVAENRNLIF